MTSNNFKTNKTMARSLNEANRSLDHVAALPVTLPMDLTGGFPAQYQSLENPPFLEKMNVGKAFAPANTQVVFEVTDADVQKMEEKESMYDQVRFDTWVADNWVKTKDPALNEWLKKIYPEYFEARKAEKNELHHIRSHIEDIMINGPETKEDLFLLFRLSRDPQLVDRITGDTGYQRPDDNENRIKRGMLNKHKVNRMGANVSRGDSIRAYLAGLTSADPAGLYNIINRSIAGIGGGGAPTGGDAGAGGSDGDAGEVRNLFRAPGGAAPRVSIVAPDGNGIRVAAPVIEAQQVAAPVIEAQQVAVPAQVAAPVIEAPTIAPSNVIQAAQSLGITAEEIIALQNAQLKQINDAMAAEARVQKAHGMLGNAMKRYKARAQIKAPQVEPSAPPAEK